MLTANRQSRNPVAFDSIPVAVSIASFALFTDQRFVHITAVAPAPAHGRQMIATRGLVTDGAIVTIGQAMIAITALFQRVLVAEGTALNGHIVSL